MWNIFVVFVAGISSQSIKLKIMKNYDLDSLISLADPVEKTVIE